MVNLNPKEDINRFYESRNERGTELTSIMDRVDATIQGLEEYRKRAMKN